MVELKDMMIEIGVTEEQIRAEMTWLRSIDFNDERDIRRAAREIKLSLFGKLRKAI